MSKTNGARVLVAVKEKLDGLENRDEKLRILHYLADEMGFVLVPKGEPDDVKGRPPCSSST